MQQNELTESVIYEKIAAFAKGEENRQTLLRLSQEEKAHYLIWKKYTGLDMKPKASRYSNTPCSPGSLALPSPSS